MNQLNELILGIVVWSVIILVCLLIHKYNNYNSFALRRKPKLLRFYKNLKKIEMYIGKVLMFLIKTIFIILGTIIVLLLIHWTWDWIISNSQIVIIILLVLILLKR